MEEKLLNVQRLDYPAIINNNNNKDMLHLLIIKSFSYLALLLSHHHDCYLNLLLWQLKKLYIEFMLFGGSGFLLIEILSFVIILF